MLLRAVVEVALDLAALGVARGHDPRARGAKLRVGQMQLVLEAVVLDSEEKRVPGDVDELRIRIQRSRRARRPPPCRRSA